MILRNLLLMKFCVVLVSGCIPPTECDWTEIIGYSSVEKLEAVAATDPGLVRRIYEHNTKREQFCTD